MTHRTRRSVRAHTRPGRHFGLEVRVRGRGAAPTGADHVRRLVVVHRGHVDHVSAVLHRFRHHVGVNVATPVRGPPVARDVTAERFHLDALWERGERRIG